MRQRSHRAGRGHRAERVRCTVFGIRRHLFQRFHAERFETAILRLKPPIGWVTNARPSRGGIESRGARFAVTATMRLPFVTRSNERFHIYHCLKPLLSTAIIETAIIRLKPQIGRVTNARARGWTIDCVTHVSLQTAIHFDICQPVSRLELTPERSVKPP